MNNFKKKLKWDKLANAESATGTWDFFNVDGKLKLCKVDGEDKIENYYEIPMTEEEWLDLIALIKRIS